MFAQIENSEAIWVYDKSQFDPVAIRHCGQIFVAPPCRFIHVLDNIVIQAKEDCPKLNGSRAEWLFNYFDLSTDYNKIKAEFARFPVLAEPMAVGGGIRILRQPFVRTVISFIISANNNIKRFSKTIAQIDFDNLGKYTEADFVEMGCGYRAPYLVKTIAMLSADPRFTVEALAALSDDECRRTLMFLPGVGPKVADCIMLFALHRLNIVPRDVWIKRAEMELGSAAAEIFTGPYAGVAQQYLFYAMQNKGLSVKVG